MFVVIVIVTVVTVVVMAIIMSVPVIVVTSHVIGALSTDCHRLAHLWVCLLYTSPSPRDRG